MSSAPAVAVRERPKCEACGETWPRIPTLEVPCPVCRAAVGRGCVSRAPSEHVKSGAFQGLHPWGHAERERAAMDAGVLRLCPAGETARAQRVVRSRTLDLFAAATP